MMARQMAVTRRSATLAEVEEKLRKLKAWDQNFDTAADPVVKRMESLRAARSTNCPTPSPISSTCKKRWRLTPSRVPRRPDACLRARFFEPITPEPGASH